MTINKKQVVNENQIVFRRDVGHNHDGLTSSLIDYKKYSIFDFVPYPVAPPGSPRRVFQENNVKSLKTFIVSAVEERVLNPQGIRIQANSITAREIVSGTITADKLTSNVVLVNNIISSNNFNGTFYANGQINSSGTTGWAISHAGVSIFNDTTIRGTITASTITGSTISIGSNTTSVFNVDSSGNIWSGSSALNTAPFSVTSTGNLSATNASISGVLTAGTGSSVGGWSTDNSRLFKTSGSNLIELVSATDPSTTSVINLKFDNFPSTQRTIQQSSLKSSGFTFSLNATGLSVGLGYITRNISLTSSGDLVMSEDNGTVNPALISNTAVRATGITTSGIINAFQYTGTTADINSVANNFATVAIRRNYSGVTDKTFIVFARGTTPVGSITYGDNNDKVSYNTTSDARLKEKIKPINNALDIIYKIEPVSYFFKTGGGEQHGFIAQDLYKTYSNIVTKPLKDEDRWMVDYAGITPLLTAGIKELYKKINELEKRFKKLEGENNDSIFE